jgi:hypothetical protein
LVSNATERIQAIPEYLGAPGSTPLSKTRHRRHTPWRNRWREFGVKNGGKRGFDEILRVAINLGVELTD